MHLLQFPELVSDTPPEDECLASWYRAFDRRASRLGIGPQDRTCLFRGHNVDDPEKIDTVILTIPWEVDVRKYRPKHLPVLSTITRIHDYFLPNYHTHPDGRQLTDREKFHNLLRMLPNKNGLGVHHFRYLGPVLLELLPPGRCIAVSFVCVENIPTTHQPIYSKTYHIKDVFSLKGRHNQTCKLIPFKDEKRATWKLP